MSLQAFVFFSASCTLPAGVGCAVLPFAIHRDKKIWGPDADSFSPDRFLPEHCAARHPCAFIPFSFGARNCIGKNFIYLRVLPHYYCYTIILSKLLNWNVAKPQPRTKAIGTS